MPRPLDSTARFRFAPSPTGTLHVGGARTALFNWLLARRHKAAMILRIEDTDRERSTEPSVQAILDGLTWLGIDWDEGPFFQSERNDLYRETCNTLLERGKAYPCFCTKERLDATREKAQSEGRAFVYDGHCRDIAAAEARRRVEVGEAHTLRFRIETGSVTNFNDLIGGERRFENDTLGDFVIQRSDGSPIYHLTVVVDDHVMGITHAVRGDDHLSNTPRQILIFEAMGWQAPDYAHLPLIQGPDRSRLSKRHGATSVMQFAEEGFLPEAMFNFLGLLGWSLDAETEIMSRETMVDNFSLDRINRSAAVFDRKKLEWMNGMYMRTLGAERVAELLAPRLAGHGVGKEYLVPSRLAMLAALEIERSKTLAEMEDNLGYFFVDSISEYEEKAAQKHFLKEGSAELLAKLAEQIQNAPDFEPAALETQFRAFADAEGVGFGKMVHPLRLALTGRSVSPGIFEVVAGLGRERSARRLLDAREWIEQHYVPASQGPEDIQ